MEDFKVDDLMQQFPEVPFEERFIGLEKQSWIMYLQLNAITKILLDKGILDRDDVTAEMDDLNEELYEMTRQVLQAQKEAAEAEAETEKTE